MRPDHILFFFCALGVFNGLLLTGYLLWPVRTRQTATYWLGGLVGMLVIRVGVSCGYYFAGKIPWSVVQLGMVANVMIGPFLVVYLTERLPVGEGGRHWARSILITQAIALLVFGLLYSFEANPYVWDWQLRFVFHALLTGYLLVAGYLLWRYGKRDRQADWLTAIVVLTCYGICLGFAVSLYVDYSLGPLLATFFSYLGAGAWLYRTSRPVAPVTPITFSEDFAAIEAVMREQRLFTRPELKLADLASALELPAARISRALKEHTAGGFARYLADWRVREAKDLLTTRPELTVEAIGYAAGFHSRSSFFAAFKERTGLTPRAFQRLR